MYQNKKKFGREKLAKNAAGGKSYKDTDTVQVKK